jgi:hypothetical protein
MTDCESSREGNEDAEARRRNSQKRAGRTTYPRKELPISMKLCWSVNRCGPCIPAGTCLAAGHIADTIAYPGRVIRTADDLPWLRKECCGKIKMRKDKDMVDLVGIEPTTSSMPWKRAPSCATGPRMKTKSRPPDKSGLRKYSNHFHPHYRDSQRARILLFVSTGMFWHN